MHCQTTRVHFNITTVFSPIDIFGITIKWSWDRLMFIMKIPVLVRGHICLNGCQFHCVLGCWHDRNDIDIMAMPSKASRPQPFISHRATEFGMWEILWTPICWAPVQVRCGMLTVLHISYLDSLVFMTISRSVFCSLKVITPFTNMD